MKKSKISIMQVSRILIQILFFIWLPSLYINTFHGIKDIYSAVVFQNVSFTQLIPQLLEVVAIVPFTIIAGRFFCGWMCAYGAFGDFIYKISHKIFKIDFRINEDTDNVLKYFKYVVLAFLIFIVCTFKIDAFSTFSPWDAFGVIASVGKVPDLSYAAANLTVGFILFILITIASIFVERFFCRYLCPLGAVFVIISKLRIVKIKKERTKCGKCRICTNNCAMGIPLYKYDIVKSGECINCMQCVTSCPRSNVTPTVSEKDVRPLIAGAAAASVITGVYYVGKLSVSAAGLNTAQVQTQETQSAKGSYKDGTYEGSGTGFRGGTTKVSVVVKNGRITDITTVSNEDTSEFYDRAFTTVVQEIVSKQSTEVDAVSGATFSSNGIMEAVKNALSSNETSSNSNSSSSGVSSTNNTQKDESSSQQQTEPDSSVSSSTNAKYKDGTYEGSGTGFRGGTTKVSVVVKNGKISDITTVSSEDTPRFYDGAFDTVSQEIITNQSSNVDGVSGATFSSRGIMQAVQSALSKAV